jgi:hypothetical protein
MWDEDMEYNVVQRLVTIRGSIMPGTSLIPTITSATDLSATVDEPFTYQIQATQSPTIYSTVGLPTSLTLDPVTGIITGTLRDSGQILFQVNATNAIGTGSAIVTVTTRAVWVTPTGSPWMVGI